jgi:hypothetical protein
VLNRIEFFNTLQKAATSFVTLSFALPKASRIYAFAVYYLKTLAKDEISRKRSSSRVPWEQGENDATVKSALA